MKRLKCPNNCEQEVFDVDINITIKDVRATVNENGKLVTVFDDLNNMVNDANIVVTDEYTCTECDSECFWEDEYDEIVQTHLELLKEAQQNYKGVYIAVMPNEEGHDLEVEVNEGTIAFTWSTGTDSIDQARIEADNLEKSLKEAGINTYHSREEWENAYEETN